MIFLFWMLAVVIGIVLAVDMLRARKSSGRDGTLTELDGSTAYRNIYSMTDTAKDARVLDEDEVGVAEERAEDERRRAAILARKLELEREVESLELDLPEVDSGPADPDQVDIDLERMFAEAEQAAHLNPAEAKRAETPEPPPEPPLESTAKATGETATVDADMWGGGAGWDLDDGVGGDPAPATEEVELEAELAELAASLGLGDLELDDSREEGSDDSDVAPSLPTENEFEETIGSFLATLDQQEKEIEVEPIEEDPVAARHRETPVSRRPTSAGAHRKTEEETDEEGGDAELELEELLELELDEARAEAEDEVADFFAGLEDAPEIASVIDASARSADEPADEDEGAEIVSIAGGARGIAPAAELDDEEVPDLAAMPSPSHRLRDAVRAVVSRLSVASDESEPERIEEGAPAEISASSTPAPMPAEPEPVPAAPATVKSQPAAFEPQPALGFAQSTASVFGTVDTAAAEAPTESGAELNLDTGDSRERVLATRGLDREHQRRQIHDAFAQRLADRRASMNREAAARTMALQT